MRVVRRIGVSCPWWHLTLQLVTDDIIEETIKGGKIIHWIKCTHIDRIESIISHRLICTLLLGISSILVKLIPNEQDG